MTNLTHYRYLILAVISFLFSANFPVLAGTNIAGLGNLARAQQPVNWYNTLTPIANVLIAAFLFGASIGTIIYIIIYILFFMKKSDKKGS